MKLDRVDDVIAVREIESIENQKKIIVTVGRPKKYPDGVDYYCPYKIIGINRDNVRYGSGVDAIQALLLAMAMIGADLYGCAEGRSGKFRWIGDETGNLGLPTPESLKNALKIQLK